MIFQGTENLRLVMIELEITYYQETGHVVAYYLLGFPPKSIEGALYRPGRRSTGFLRTRTGRLQTPLASERPLTSPWLPSQA